MQPLLMFGTSICLPRERSMQYCLQGAALIKVVFKKPKYTGTKNTYKLLQSFWHVSYT